MGVLCGHQIRQIAGRNQSVIDKVFPDTALHPALASDQGGTLPAADKAETPGAVTEALIACPPGKHGDHLLV
jgi:hypothetical protein